MSIIETIGEWMLGKVQPDLIDLGSSVFRRLRGEWRGQRFVVDEYVEVPAAGILDVGLEQDTWVIDQSRWDAAIRQLFGGRTPRDRHVALVLPDQAFKIGVTYLSQVMMKSQPRLGLEKEVNAAIPIPLSRSRLVFESGQARTGKTGVLYAVSNERGLNNLIDRTFGAGLLPLSIQPSFLMVCGLSKIVETDSSPHPSAWVHVGNRGTTVGILINGLIRRVQWLPIGGQALTIALQRGDQIPIEEAEERKRKGPILIEDPASEEQSTVPLYCFLEATFVDLLQGIYAVLQAHSQEFPTEGSYRRIVLSGGGSTLANFDRLVSGNFGLPVTASGSFLGVQQKELSLSSDLIGALAPLLGMALLQPWRLNRMDRLVA